MYWLRRKEKKTPSTLGTLLNAKSVLAIYVLYPRYAWCVHCSFWGSRIWSCYRARSNTPHHDIITTFTKQLPRWSCCCNCIADTSIIQFPSAHMITFLFKIFSNRPFFSLPWVKALVCQNSDKFVLKELQWMLGIPRRKKHIPSWQALNDTRSEKTRASLPLIVSVFKSKEKVWGGKPSQTYTWLCVHFFEICWPFRH